MEIHPIEGLMKSAMDSIQKMVDVNTIIGEPIETSNNMVIIPISKVSFGFAAGGSEFKGETINEYKKIDKEEQIQYRLPFGGGSGATVSITPVAFVVVSQDSIKLMPVEHASTIDKLLDYVPDLMERTTSIVTKAINTKNASKENDNSDEKTNTENSFKGNGKFDKKNFDNINSNSISYSDIDNETYKENSKSVADKNYGTSKPVGSVSRVIPKEVEIEYDEMNKSEEYLEDE
jgi:sporulation protein YtfJ